MAFLCRLKATVSCQKYYEVPLSERMYHCNCGYTKPRDWHSADSILMEALANSSIPDLERIGYQKPVEPKITTAMLRYFNSIPGVVANLLVMKQEAHEFIRG